LVSGSGEGFGDIAEVGAEEYSKGLAVLAVLELVFIAMLEAGVHFGEEFVSDSGEVNDAEASTFPLELFELEGALGGASDTLDLFGVHAQAFSGLEVGASVDVSLEDFALVERLHIGVNARFWGRVGHSRGFYHE
jgi:hypothetical protein